MIKKTVVMMIKCYRMISGSMPRVCRFHPTCSAYMIEAMEHRGLLRGVITGLRRIMRCHPFNQGGYDPLR